MTAITTTPEFESWWAEYGVKIDPPILTLGFKEIAAKAWNAATSSIPASAPASSVKRAYEFERRIAGYRVTDTRREQIEAFNHGQQRIAVAFGQPTYARIMLDGDTITTVITAAPKS